MRTWTKDAACKGHDVSIFFVEPGESTQPAKDICAGCPVAEECLQDALAIPNTHGIWAGTTARERERIRRETSLNIERKPNRPTYGRRPL